MEDVPAQAWPKITQIYFKFYFAYPSSPGLPLLKNMNSPGVGQIKTHLLSEEGLLGTTSVRQLELPAGICRNIDLDIKLHD